MKVELLHNTPLFVASKAIRTCWDSHDKSDTTQTEPYLDYDINGYDEREYFIAYPECGPKDRELIDRVSNKNKHESVKNHISYSFEITGITTKTLLALTRHDVGVEFSVQSTRYTTKKAVKNGTAGYTKSKNEVVNKYLNELHNMIQNCVQLNIDNDEISLLLPQAWQYNLVATFSMQALQHFLKLRTKRDAHWDIQELAKHLYEAIPPEHTYLFEEYTSKN